MKLVLHLLAKDSLRLRIPLLVWGVLLVLQFTSLGWWPGAGADPRLQLMLALLHNLVAPLQMLMLITIVPLLVHEDPVIGSTAFWVTRPITGGLLLASKTLFVFLFLIIPPLMIDVAGLVARGAPDKDLVFAGSALLLVRVKFLVLLFTLAALTQTFSRFALTAVVLVVCYVTVGFLLLVIGLYASRESGGARVIFTGSSGTLSDLATIGFAVAMIINQYLTRKTVRSWILLACGMIVLLAIGKFQVGDRTPPTEIQKTFSMRPHHLVPDHGNCCSGGKIRARLQRS